MIKMRREIAFILIAIYGIVFAHNVIPHHHHSDLISNLSAVFECENSHHHHHDQEGHSHHPENNLNIKEEINHHHSQEKHEACHFDVRPVLAKTLTVYPAIIEHYYFRFNITVRELPKQEFVYYPQKLLQSYNFAVPLRAPPVFS